MGDSSDPSIFYELFKKVRPDEILEDLKQFGVDVNPEAFTNPKSKESLGLYSLAIQVVFGKTSHDIRPEEIYRQLIHPPNELLGVDFSSENVDFFKNGIGNLRLWRYCQKLHSILGLKQIQRYELFNPTPKSFYDLISSFVVYLRFREAIYSLYEVSVSNLDFLAEKELRLSEDIMNLIKENQKFKGVMADTSAEHQLLLNNKRDLEGKLLSANEEFTRFKNRKKELDLEMSKIKNLLNDTMLSKSKARYTFDDLSEHVTTNIETASKLYTELKAEDANQRQRLDSLSSKAEELRAKYSKLLEASSVFDRLKVNLSDHYKDVVVPHVESLEFLKKASVQISKLNDRIAELTRKRDSLLSDLERHKKVHEEKLKKLGDESQTRIDQAKKFASESKSGNEVVLRKITDVKLMIEHVNDKISETRANSFDLFSKIDERLESLKESAYLYNEKIQLLNKRLTEA
ncbi:hypothetical protein MACK_003450 [Theileria orientalis]|uniref:Kinetochore protein Nuf2 N-terminal domain-containing protein n=1 Tax=Theileria orientalis TaxID=68886 RepID=A0A976SJ57_THEOR|nr:hypothetical protein MACK_003450 [Theileria orientalis]